MHIQTKKFLYEKYQITEQVIDFVTDAEHKAVASFENILDISQHNQAKVLFAFQAEGVAQRHFAPTTGYGYDDIGRDTLERVFSRVFGTKDALVRPQLASGTHAISLALFGLLQPTEEMLCVTGKPYDTLEQAIGIGSNTWGSLKSLGISYEQVELLSDGSIDIRGAIAKIKPNTKIVYLQRSRGYAWRRALSIDMMREAIAAIKHVRPDILIVVDNCYGEFTAPDEPTNVGADVIAGSLIKNPGGGLAPTGGYIAGSKEAIEHIANRMTSPGIGREVGSYAASYAPFFQGLFIAPHIVAESLKGATLGAAVFEKLGFDVLPNSSEKRGDIIQSIRFRDEKLLIAFCQSIQKASPVDSFAAPYPWDMPGYQHRIIMAAGTFVQGASIELSADAPIKEPYIAYMQGGLTYEHVKLALMCAIRDMINAGAVYIK